MTLGRSANITKPINGRAPCHYCGPCHQGCVTHSYFNSAFTTVADALKTGKCTHIPNAMVYQVLMDRDRNRARGVLYIDRVTHEPREVQGRVVILCAQALESVRILFNSGNRQYPNGLANSSGVVGKYLMFGGGASARGLFENPLNEYKSVQSSRLIEDFYDADQKRGFMAAEGSTPAGAPPAPSVSRSPACLRTLRAGAPASRTPARNISTAP